MCLEPFLKKKVCINEVSVWYKHQVISKYNHFADLNPFLDKEKNPLNYTVTHERTSTEPFCFLIGHTGGTHAKLLLIISVFQSRDGFKK